MGLKFRKVRGPFFRGEASKFTARDRYCANTRESLFFKPIKSHSSREAKRIILKNETTASFLCNCKRSYSGNPAKERSLPTLLILPSQYAMVPFLFANSFLPSWIAQIALMKMNILRTLHADLGPSLMHAPTFSWLSLSSGSWLVHHIKSCW